MTRDELGELNEAMHRKRTRIAEVLFSPQRYQHQLGTARKVVELANELVQMAITERKGWADLWDKNK